MDNKSSIIYVIDDDEVEVVDLTKDDDDEMEIVDPTTNEVVDLTTDDEVQFTEFRPEVELHPIHNGGLKTEAIEPYALSDIELFSPSDIDVQNRMNVVDPLYVPRLITEDIEITEGTVPEDDPTGDQDHQYFQSQEVLTSGSSNYQVLDTIGEGAYGAVYRCWSGAQEVAVKVLKPEVYHQESGRREAKILKKIGGDNANGFNLIKMFDSFVFRGQLCLVFELLEQSLAQLVQKYRWLSRSQVRPILKGLALALDKLLQLGIVHADIKLDNIMVVNQEARPFFIKLIDFGLAHHVGDQETEPYIQTRFYRAPEILLGDQPYSTGIDMWSVGCVAAECVMGEALYPGRCEYDQIRFITDTQGEPDRQMLNRGSKTMKFFTSAPDMPESWRLKTVDEFVASPFCEDPGNVIYDYRSRPLTHLDQIAEESINECICAATDRRAFLDLMQEILTINPEERIRPHQVLEHRFLTLSHLKRLRALKICTDHEPIEDVHPCSVMSEPDSPDSSNEWQYASVSSKDEI